MAVPPGGNEAVFLVKVDCASVVSNHLDKYVLLIANVLYHRVDHLRSIDHPQAADVRPSLSPRLACGDHAENMCRPCDGPSLEDTDGSASTVDEGRVTAG